MLTYYHEIAAAITTVLTIAAFFPQIWKTLRTKHAMSLSPSAFVASYSGSVVLCVFSSIHNPFVWTTLIVDLSICWLTLPIFWYIARDHWGKRLSPPFWIGGFVALNGALTALFALTRTGVVPTGITEETEFALAVVGYSLTGLAFLPQVVTIVKNRSLGDFSLALAIIYGVAQSLNVVFWSGRIVVERTDWLDWVPGLVLAGASVLVQASAIAAAVRFGALRRKNRRVGASL